jgi:hypothetical protein
MCYAATERWGLETGESLLNFVTIVTAVVDDPAPRTDLRAKITAVCGGDTSPLRAPEREGQLHVLQLPHLCLDRLRSRFPRSQPGPLRRGSSSRLAGRAERPRPAHVLVLR